MWQILKNILFYVLENVLRINLTIEPIVIIHIYIGQLSNSLLINGVHFLKYDKCCNYNFVYYLK